MEINGRTVTCIVNSSQNAKDDFIEIMARRIAELAFEDQKKKRLAKKKQAKYTEGRD
ncbi:hypothetical protein [Pectinatus frisingensis]|uniref:hypothetical protein n=1 Tax=Pectinatus frisingensis TaxID=865 RepID=UPI0018C56DB4|nr:hypothetical protein [Pectinatus frisingensis]